MTRTIHTTQEPVRLEGYQAVLRPSKFGYSLKALVDQELVDKLEEEREDCLKWCLSKVKNPKRSVQKPEPWEEVSEGQYLLKFSWKEDKKPPIVDTEGTPVTDPNIPVYSGSLVKLGFIQKPYILKDQTTYGTSLKLSGVQIVSTKGEAGVDSGDLDTTAVAELFGKTVGYKIDEPNPQFKHDLAPSSVEESDDF
tara:strand:+ start:3490 stop:4074 length:585 start_codon:yes stop_codon:yes gene_type:complete